MKAPGTVHEWVRAYCLLFGHDDPDISPPSLDLTTEALVWWQRQGWHWDPR